MFPRGRMLVSLAVNNDMEDTSKITTLLSLRYLLNPIEHTVWISPFIDTNSLHLILHHGEDVYVLWLQCEQSIEEGLVAIGDNASSLSNHVGSTSKLMESLVLSIRKLDNYYDLNRFDNTYFVFFTKASLENSQFFMQSCSTIFSSFHDSADVYKFNSKDLSYLVSMNNMNYINKVYLCVNKVFDIDNAIVSEVTKRLYTLNTGAPCIRNGIKLFINDIKNWLDNGSGILTPEVILAKLTESLFSHYQVALDKCRSCDISKMITWKKVIKDKIVTMVSGEKALLDFISDYMASEVCSYLNQEFNSWAQELTEKQQSMFYQKHGLKLNILKLITNHRKATWSDIYKYLCMTNELPFVLRADTKEDHQNILDILKLSRYRQKIIIVNNSGETLPCNDEEPFKSFVSLNNLNEEERGYILGLKVKLQGRGPCLVSDILEENMFEDVKSSDVIKIICNTFSIGDCLKSVPEYFIERCVYAIFIDARIFNEVSDEAFIIQENSVDDLALHLSVRKYIDLDSNVLDQCKIVVNRKTISRQQLKELSFQLKAIHHLKKCNDKQLQWVESSGLITNIKQFIVERTDLENIPSDKCYSKDLLILNGSPGMGKSTLMDLLGAQAPTTKWVVRIDLIEHQNYYRSDACKSSSANASTHLDYFVDLLLRKHSHKSSLSSKVFDKFKRTKSVIVMLDGFDEVSVCYKEEVTNIIKAFQEEQYCVWVSTRPVMKSYLEEQLTSLAVDLAPFSFNNQTEFLLKYLIVQNPNLSLSVDRNPNKLVKKVLEVANRSSDQLETPLLIKLLSDVFHADFIEYIFINGDINLNNFNSYYLYEQFIERKLDNLSDKFGANEKSEKAIMKEHQSLFALKLLFPLQNTDLSKELNYYKDHPHKIQLLQREGIIIIDEELNPSFSHRTFAEYLAADWLSKRINSKYTQTLIQERFSDDYTFLFNVFDRMLARNCPLHMAIMNGEVDTAKGVLSSDSSAITAIDTGGRSVLHIMALYSIRFPLLFHQYANFYPSSRATRFLDVKAFERDTVLDIFEQIPYYKILTVKTDILGFTPLDYALANNSLAAADKIYAKSKTSVIKASISLNFKKSYLGYCALLNYKSLFNLLLPYFAARDLLLKNVDRNLNVRSYFQSIYSSNLYTRSILNYRFELESMTTLDLLQSRSGEAYSGYVNGCYSDLRYAIALGSKENAKTIALEDVEVNKTDHDYNSPLHYAAWYGHLDIVNILLTKGAEVDTQNVNGDTPLHLALREGFLEIADCLMAKGSDENAENKRGETPLLYAVQQGSCDMVVDILSKKASNSKQSTTLLRVVLEMGQLRAVKFFIDNGADVNLPNRLGETALHSIIHRGYKDLAMELVIKGVFNNNCDIDGNTPLHLALIEDQVHLAEALISNGADVNISNCRGETALYRAVDRNYIEIVNKILSREAAVNIKTWNGDTPLHLALARGYLGIIQLLISNGADVNIASRDNPTALHILLQKNYFDVVKPLSAAGIINNESDTDGNTLLHLTLIKGELDMAEILICHGADLHISNNGNESILHHASNKGCDKIINRILLEGSNEINQRTYSTGDTALHLALKNKFMDTATLLISNGADVNVENKSKDTPLSIAVENGYDILQDILLNTTLNNDWSKDGDTLLHLALHKNRDDIAKLLIIHGVDVNKWNKRRETGLLLAIQKGYNDLMASLITKEVVNVKRKKDGNTPLHWAIAKDDYKTIQLLLENGASATIGNKNGTTLLHCAVKKGIADILLQVLSSADLDVDQQNKRGNTALHLAMLKNYFYASKWLLEKGANPEIKNSKGKTVFDMALENDDKKVIALFKS